MNRLVEILLATALVVGCGTKKKEEPAATPAVRAGSAMAGSAMTGSAMAGSAMTGSASVGSAATVAVDVPTEMDFEDQAKTKITDKNVEAQVKTLEDDLGK